MDLARHCRQLLCARLPVQGRAFPRRAVDTWLQIGLPPTPGIDLIVQTRVPAEGERPAIDVHSNGRGPVVTGASGSTRLVPPLVGGGHEARGQKPRRWP
jgi:hypothetical protein